MPKKKNTKKPMKPNNRTQQQRDAEEASLYDWLLAQRILDEAGALEAFKVATLSETMPGWNSKPVDEEIGRALTSNDEELNAALETWWNKLVTPDTPLTLREIRALAFEDGVGKPEWAC